MIHFKCGKCGKKLAAKDESAGKRVKCPACGQVLQAPAAGLLYVIGLFVFGGGAIAAQQSGSQNPQEAMAKMTAMSQGMMGWGLLCLIVFVIGYAAEIYSGVIGFILLYKMWSALQAGPVRVRPGKAVGLLFIPFYNFYWVFQAILGWAQDYNAFIAQRGIDGPQAPEGLAKTICILALVGAVPCIGLLVLPVVFILALVFDSKAIDCVNALALVPKKVTGPMGMA